MKREMIVIAKSDQAKFLVAFQGKDGKNVECHFFSSAQALATLVNHLACVIADLEYEINLEEPQRDSEKTKALP
jgi:hypothetical protein